MRSHGIVWLACVLAVVGSAAGVQATAAPQPQQPSLVDGADFNGDGYGDLALSGSDDSGDLGGSLVRVMYGSRTGLSTRRMQALELEQLVEHGAEGLNEGFSAGRLTSGDFDGDGCTDLAVGIPGLEVNGQASAGGVLLLRGTAQGLDLQSRQLITQASPGVDDEPEEEDGFGNVLAAGDLGRGHEDDLVIGVPDEDHPSGVYDGGQVHVLYGSPNGVDLSTSQLWRQSSPGVEGRAGDSDNWGSLLVTGDFDGSGTADLAVGNPGDHYHETAEHGSGTVQVLYSSPDGLTAKGSQRWSAGMSVLQQRGVYGFPGTMAAGDLDDDGCDDLVLASGGGPRFDTAGSISVLYGSRTGIRADRTQVWSQDSVGIAGVPGDSEWFGLGLAIGSFGRDSPGRRYDDLAVGVDESAGGVPGSGAVHIIFGGPLGLTGSSSQVWSQSSPGVPGVSEDGDGFGRGLAANDFGHNRGGGRVDDLAVVASYEVIGDSDLNCSLTVLYGDAGLTSRASRRWTPTNFGLPANGFGYFPETISS